jgi:hypothetical protein
MAKCTKKKNPKPKPKLKGKKARYVCDRCGMKARKKNQVCKAEEV